MTAEEIQLFNHSIAYHQPVAIGSFLLFALIYRSKFYNYKGVFENDKKTTNNKAEVISIEES